MYLVRKIYLYKIQEIVVKAIDETSKKISKQIKYLHYEGFKNSLTAKISSTNIKSFNELIKLIQQEKQLFTKTRTIKTRSNEWINLELVTMFKERDKLYVKLKQNPNNQEIHQQFKKIKNKCNNLRKRLKLKYIQAKFDKATGDDRKTWKVINQVIKNKFTGDREKKLDYITIDNKKIENCEDMANKLNEYFINNGYTISKEVEAEKIIRNVKFREQHEEKTIFLEPVNSLEIRSIVLSLKNNSAPGLDGITTNDLKAMLDILLPVLVTLINKSLECGVFPEELKETSVIQVHKKGDYHDPDNKRPISLIMTFSKILERVIKTRVTSFICKTFGYDKQQFGFQAESNTQMATTEVIEYITTGLDEKKYVIATFIDLKKAFDTVNHKILLEKLYQMGIRGVAHELMSSYLENRKQSTVVNSIRSQTLTVKTGVPQGSVLGPLLYLLYVHNLSLVNLKTKYVTFADDTVLLSSHDNFEVLETLTNSDLKMYHDWLVSNNLKMNANKTVFMVFSQKGRPNPSISLHIDGATIRSVSDYKYLGLTIDNKLKFDKHIDSVRVKIASLSGALKNCAHYLTSRTKHLIYNTMIETHLRYMITVWGSAPGTELQKLQRTQNRVLIILNELHWSFPTKSLYETLNLLNIDGLRKLEECKLIYKIKHSQTKTNMILISSSEVHNYATRQCGNFYIQQSRTNKKLNSVMTRSTRTFDSIPESMRNTSQVQFGKLAKQHLLELQNNFEHTS